MQKTVRSAARQVLNAGVTKPIRRVQGRSQNPRSARASPSARNVRTSPLGSVMGCFPPGVSSSNEPTSSGRFAPLRRQRALRAGGPVVPGAPRSGALRLRHLADEPQAGGAPVFTEQVYNACAATRRPGMHQRKKKRSMPKLCLRRDASRNLLAPGNRLALQYKTERAV